MKRYAVIPTGNRKDDYLSVIEWCKKHNVTTVTIATSDDARDYSVGKVISDRELNISRWWDLGLNWIAEKEFETDDNYTVAILNDDAVMPDNWYEKLEPFIKQGFSGASGLRYGSKQLISGYAFLLNGKHDVRPDSELVWFWGDDAIQRRCEEEGGFKLVENIEVGNKYANSEVTRFAEQIEKDRIRYREKYVKNKL